MALQVSTFYRGSGRCLGALFALLPICGFAQSGDASGANDFNSWFPGFVDSCSRLHDLLVPFAMAVMVLGFAFQFWQGQSSGPDIFWFLIKLFLIVSLISHSHDLINQAQESVQSFVDQNIPARPEAVIELYKTKLAEAQNAPEIPEQSFGSLLFSANFFEAIVLAVLTLISWVAMAVLFFVFILQKVALLMCWSFSPALWSLFVIPPLSYLAFRHLMRILGLILWPIGVAIASTITEGLVADQTRANFLDGVPVAGAVGWGLQQVLALTVIAIWMIFSSVAAPWFIQRLVSDGSGPAGFLTRAGELIAGLGLPSLLHGASRWRNTPPSSHSKNAAGESARSAPIPAMPPETPPPPPTDILRAFTPNGSDRTAQTVVEQTLSKPLPPES